MKKIELIGVLSFSAIAFTAIMFFFIVCFIKCSGSSDRENAEGDSIYASCYDIKDNRPPEVIYISTLKEDSAQLFSFKYKDYMDSNDKILHAASFYDNIANDISQKITFKETIRMKRLRNKIRDRLLMLQIKSFPILRKKFAQNMASIMWEHDVYVTSSGSKNTTLNISGGIYAANSNIQQNQNIIENSVSTMRFKRVSYRWYKGAEESTYYKIQTISDNKIKGE